MNIDFSGLLWFGLVLGIIACLVLQVVWTYVLSDYPLVVVGMIGGTALTVAGQRLYGKWIS